MYCIPKNVCVVPVIPLSVYVILPYVLFVFLYGSQVFALLMFFFVILHTMSSGKNLQLLCILPFGMLCLSALLLSTHSHDPC